MKWINEHWQLIAGLAAATVFVVAQSIAYGEQVQRIKTLEQAVQAQVQQQTIVVDIQKEAAASFARQQMIIEMLKEIRQDIKDANK